MTDHELDAALGELDPGPSGSFHGEVMSRIEELDALREQYRRQTRTSRGVWLGGLAIGVAGAGAALLGPHLPGCDLRAALTAISATNCPYWAPAAALAVTAALVAFDAPDGEGSRKTHD
jgi:hypothetical protein